MSDKEYLIRPLGSMNLNKLSDYMERNYPMNQEKGNFDFICKTKLKDNIAVGKRELKQDETFLVINSENGEPPKFGLLQKWNAEVIPLDDVVDVLDEKGKSYTDVFLDTPLQVRDRTYMTNLNPEIENDDLLSDEMMNRSIIESVVEDHLENMDEWSLSESEGVIVLEMDGEEKSYTSFGEALKDIGESIEEDLYNHQDYLNEEQISYLKAQGFDIPEQRKEEQTEVIHQKDFFVDDFATYFQGLDTMLQENEALALLRCGVPLAARYGYKDKDGKIFSGHELDQITRNMTIDEEAKYMSEKQLREFATSVSSVSELTDIQTQNDGIVHLYVSPDFLPSEKVPAFIYSFEYMTDPNRVFFSEGKCNEIQHQLLDSAPLDLDKFQRIVNTYLTDDILQKAAIKTNDLYPEKNRTVQSYFDFFKKQVQTVTDSGTPVKHKKNPEYGKARKTNRKELAKKIESQISITDVVRDAGYNLKKNGTTSYTTEEHNSLVLDLKTNRFYWNSRPPRPEDVERAQKQIEKTGKGHIPHCLSGGVITFYMVARDVAYREAVQQLAKQINLSVEIPEKVKRSVDTNHTKMTPIERHKYLQSQLLENKYQNQNMKNVKAYLIKTRKIDPEIVDLFIQRNMLFQTQDKQGRTQAAFIGKDENGYLSYVNFRSTSSVSKFKGDYSGCNYDRGCFFEPEFDIPLGWKDDPQKEPINKEKRLLVFESSIEMMSYMSLLKLNGNNYKNFAYLSCGSISKSNCVLETCKAYGYDKVIVMFNNDREKKNNPGLTKANFVADQLRKEGIDAHPLVPSRCNDWNDTLVAYKEKKIELQKFKQPVKSEKVKTAGIER